MFEKIKEFIEEHTYEATMIGYVIACIGGTVAMMKWAAKLSAAAITAGINDSALGRK